MSDEDLPTIHYLRERYAGILLPFLYIFFRLDKDDEVVILALEVTFGLGCVAAHRECGVEVRGMILWLCWRCFCLLEIDQMMCVSTGLTPGYGRYKVVSIVIGESCLRLMRSRAAAHLLNSSRACARSPVTSACVVVSGTRQVTRVSGAFCKPGSSETRQEGVLIRTLRRSSLAFGVRGQQISTARCLGIGNSRNSQTDTRIRMQWTASLLKDYGLVA